MEHIEFVYTFGMTEDEIAEKLASRENGVLALAQDGAAYAVPISFHYTEGEIYLRLARHEGSKKIDYIDSTTEASFLLYEYADDGSSWSVLAVGGITKVGEGFDKTALNEQFPDLRIFDESVDDVELEIYRLDVSEITGRRTG
jgi:hypothetical protein